MTTFDRYILRRLIHTYVILFITFFGLYVVIDGFTNLDNFQEGIDDSTKVFKLMLKFYSYQSAMLFDMMGPTIAVCSVMVVSALLVKNSEYQPILAAGVPLARITVPFVAGLLIITAAVVANQELILPRIAHHLQGNRNGLSAAIHMVDPTHDYSTGILFSGKSVDLESRRLIGAEFVLPVPELVGELTTLTATWARYVPKTSKNPAGWVLSGLGTAYEDLPLTPTGMKVIRPVKGSGELFVASEISFDLISTRSKAASLTGTGELVRRIRNPALSHQMARDQMLLLHRRLVQPMLNLLAGLACIPLVIRRESRSLVGNLALAAGVQGLLFGALQGSAVLGSLGYVAADIAAWLPVIICGTVAGWLTGYAQT